MKLNNVLHFIVKITFFLTDRKKAILHPLYFHECSGNLHIHHWEFRIQPLNVLTVSYLQKKEKKKKRHTPNKKRKEKIKQTLIYSR